MEEVLVSIWCTAYNHEQYIADAIEGFLMQKTNFKYEIIIHDDASTDNTAKIIRNYEQKYPDLIHGIYQVENQFSKNQPNIEWIRFLRSQNCKGKYIADCEGDDYWIDTQKLQMQIEYLEAHPECIMMAHNSIDMDYRDFSVKPMNLYVKDKIVSGESIITQKITLHTATRVYRKEVLNMDEIFKNTGIGDYPTILYALTKGKIYYSSRIMSVYRRCHSGSWSASMENPDVSIFYNVRMINFLKKYDEYTKGKYRKACISQCQVHVNWIMGVCNDITLEEFRAFCQKYDEKLDKKYHEIFMQLFELRLQMFSEQYLHKTIENFVGTSTKIIIMGAGKYAGIVARQLEYHKIAFEGFTVSNNQQFEKKYLGKTVWRLDELPFNIEDLGVIIGINPINWSDLVEALERRGIKNYICPFLL